MERGSSGAEFHARLDLHKGETSGAGTFTLDSSSDGGANITRSRGTWKRTGGEIVTTITHEDNTAVPAPIEQRWTVRDDALHLDAPELVLKKQKR